MISIFHVATLVITTFHIAWPLHYVCIYIYITKLPARKHIARADGEDDGNMYIDISVYM